MYCTQIVLRRPRVLALRRASRYPTQPPPEARSRPANGFGRRTENRAQFHVSRLRANNQYRPSISELADGQFVVAWEDLLPPPGGSGDSVYGIRGQIFNAGGAMAGNAFEIINLSGPFVVAGADDVNVLGLSGGGFSANADDLNKETAASAARHAPINANLG